MYSWAIGSYAASGKQTNLKGEETRMKTKYLPKYIRLYGFYSSTCTVNTTATNRKNQRDGSGYRGLQPASRI